MRGLYVHIPFCAKKCAYCDFYSLAGRAAAIPDYCDSLVREASRYRGFDFQTLYLGGGTPSLLGATHLTGLLRGLRETLDLSVLTEATIELNPESTTVGLLRAARDSGINRLSLGVQSFSDAELKSVGRIHTAARAIEALNLAKRSGFSNISADIIIGLPGQSPASLERTLETLTGVGIPHISAYCLSLEEGTSLAVGPPDNLPSDDAQAELFEQAGSLLTSAGFVHYEISNFALPGFECQHNLNYWRGGEYIGLGPAAASHLNGQRWRNRADLEAYLADPGGQVEDREELDPEARAAEEAMLRLRLLSEGLDAAQLSQRYTGEALRELINRLEKLAETGDLHKEGSRYRLSPARVLTSNPVLAEVVAGR